MSSSSPSSSLLAASSSASSVPFSIPDSVMSLSGAGLNDLVAFDDLVENANLDCLGGGALPFGLPKNFLYNRILDSNST